MTFRSLLGLGISGGLLPCPAALVLFLTAVALGRVGLGLLLVLIFSLGLAAVLVAVGLLFIKGSQLLSRVPQISGSFTWVSAFSAALVLILGIGITVQALSGITL